MPDYKYVDGDGLARLDKTRPVSATEPVAILASAIRQIKAYLKDDLAGPHTNFTVTNNLPGSVILFGGEAPPEGWLLCDGQEYSRSVYLDLYSKIGITYNKPDTPAEMFCVPDFTGRVPVGTNPTNPSELGTLGDYVGTEESAMTPGNDVNHKIPDGGWADGYSQPGRPHEASFMHVIGENPYALEDSYFMFETSYAGHEEPDSVSIIQPSLKLTYLIKY